MTANKQNTVTDTFSTRLFMRRQTNTLNSVIDGMEEVLVDYPDDPFVKVSNKHYLQILKQYSEECNEGWRSLLIVNAREKDGYPMFEVNSLFEEVVLRTGKGPQPIYSLKISKLSEPFTPVLNLDGKNPTFVEVMKRVTVLYPVLNNPLTRFIVNPLTFLILNQDQIKDTWLSDDEGTLTVQYVDGSMLCEITMNYAEVLNIDVQLKQIQDRKN